MAATSAESETLHPGHLVDAWLDPAGAAASLGKQTGPIRLRAELPLAEGALPFGPEPAQSHVAVIDGPAKVSIASSPTDARTITIASVDVTARALPWGKLATPFERGVAEVALCAEDGARWIVAEVLSETEAEARAKVSTFARALAARLEVGAIGADEAPDAPPAASDGFSGGRYRYRLEADRWVLRDHEGRGPRATASRYLSIALVSGALALATWLVFGIELLGGASPSVLFLSGALALVLSIAAFALAEVARYARAYTASSTALAWFADDRIVVSPWVARNGAIDLRPEGQVGAGMRVAEIKGLRRDKHEGAIALVLESEHGPFELIRATDPAEIEAYARSIEASLALVASPQKKKTALMRAREKRDASPDTATDASA